ncbi:MAG TPA: formylglycine-generating enzyme family protein [Myxococcales bacterium]|nr:formylglycine-generating enzyme family protein [Myxococcales bacterium]
MLPRMGNEGLLVDEVSARLQGLGEMPEPSLDYPEDLARTISGHDGATAVLVPAGFFWMGSHKEKKDEKPHRIVYLDSYYIDESPVTNGQYLQFLEKSGHRKPSYFYARKAEADWEKHPVTFVSWDDAQAYAKWVHRRLPTEAEWEKAARGVDGRIWPWGNTDPADSETAWGQFGQEDSFPVAVGSFPDGASPVGALDMAGGVWEWCQDQYDQFFYPKSAPRNPECEAGDPRYRVARGGACNYSAFTARAAFRGWNLPSTRANCYGFRCVVDAARFRKKSAA